MTLFATKGKMKWNYPTLKQLFTSVTNHKNKMGKGILSSFKNYDEVSPIMKLLFFCTIFMFP